MCEEENARRRRSATSTRDTIVDGGDNAVERGGERGEGARASGEGGTKATALISRARDCRPTSTAVSNRIDGAAVRVGMSARMEEDTAVGHASVSYWAESGSISNWQQQRGVRHSQSLHTAAARSSVSYA